MYLGSGRPTLGILARMAILFGGTAAVALVSGGLTVPHGPQWNIICDLKHFVNLECSNSALEVPNENFGLFRDYATLYHLWMISAVSVWAGQLTAQLSRLLPDLWLSGALKRRPRRELERLVDAANKRVASWRVHIALLAAAFGAGATGLAGYQSEGIYAGLAPDGTDPYLFALSASDEWWASGHGLAFWWFIVVATIGNYVNWWTIYVVLEITIVMWRMRTRIDFRLDSTNQDGNWGWSPVFEAIQTASKYVLANIFGLIGIAMLANFNSIQYLAVFPVAMILSVVPFYLANAIFSNAKDQGMHRWRPRIRLEREVQTVAYSLAPATIFSTRTIIAQLAFTIIPAILGFWSEFGNE